jgi:hypothetical protein
MKNETTLNNSLREQKGLEILDIDNLKEFTTARRPQIPTFLKMQHVVLDKRIHIRYLLFAQKISYILHKKTKEMNDERRI